MISPSSSYCGRLAPSPTGHLHLGHARTFWIAAERARTAGGRLLLRNDDLDRARCRPEFTGAMQEDLRWLGLAWDGDMISQSERIPRHRIALARLHAAGLIFPCTRSRRDVREAAGAPHEGEDAGDEPLYPKEFRPPPGTPLPALAHPVAVNWRFRVPDGDVITFVDGAAGEQHAVAGRDFGDFLVWRNDDTPSYQLATTVD
ncbi:MAG: glutamate--tRNA ligase family protein, partial [Opitutus sp.]